MTEIIKLTNGKQITNMLVKARKNPNYDKYKNDSIVRIKLAEKLYKERHLKKWSMTELAKKAHTTPAIISRIEHAEKSVGIDLIARIFEALGKKQLTLRFG